MHARTHALLRKPLLPAVAPPATPADALPSLQGTGNDPLDPRENIGIAELGIVSCLHLIAIAIAIVIKKGVAEPGTSKSGAIAT